MNMINLLGRLKLDDYDDAFISEKVELEHKT